MCAPRCRRLVRQRMRLRGCKGSRLPVCVRGRLPAPAVSGSRCGGGGHYPVARFRIRLIAAGTGCWCLPRAVVVSCRVRGCLFLRARLPLLAARVPLSAARGCLHVPACAQFPFLLREKVPICVDGAGGLLFTFIVLAGRSIVDGESVEGSRRMVRLCEADGLPDLDGRGKSVRLRISDLD